MRRPPPPPTPPAGVVEDDVVPGRRSSTLRGTGDVVELPLAGDQTDAGEQPTSTRDVWRAARARRKALRAEIRRFTQRSRRRRIVWMSAIGAAVLLVGGSVAAAYSPLFAVEKVTVVGATTLDPAVVEASLAGQVGTPLALV